MKKIIEFDDVEKKYKDIIDIAKKYMQNIDDCEHDINHIHDVVYYTKLLIKKLNIDINVDVCIISAYWHDVGRIKIDAGHEKISAQMLKETMTIYKYDDILIDECCKAIENHKWNMLPKAKEGLIIKDADKLAWIGMGRWKSCLNSNQKLDLIIELLPKLRNDILYFDESKKIYDNDIVELIRLLYSQIKKDTSN